MVNVGVLLTCQKTLYGFGLAVGLWIDHSAVVVHWMLGLELQYGFKLIFTVHLLE